MHAPSHVTLIKWAIKQSRRLSVLHSVARWKRFGHFSKCVFTLEVLTYDFRKTAGQRLLFQLLFLTTLIEYVFVLAFTG